MKKYYLGSLFVYAKDKIEAIGKFYSIINFRISKAKLADIVIEGV